MAIINLYDQKKWRVDRTLTILWAVSLGILFLSFYQQYIEKIEPCSLCKWQRYVYFLVALLSPIGLIQSFNSPIKIALNLVFLIGCCIAIYHTLIQFEWIADRCEIQKIESMNDFMKMLEQQKISCATSGWKFFGIYASIYNIIISLIALIVLNFKNLKKLIHV